MVLTLTSNTNNFEVPENDEEKVHSSSLILHKRAIELEHMLQCKLANAKATFD